MKRIYSINLLILIRKGVIESTYKSQIYKNHSKIHALRK